MFKKDTISFFGSKKEFKSFEIRIEPVELLGDEGFIPYFYKPESKKFNNFKSSDVYTTEEEIDYLKRESISITIYLHCLKYKKIKYLLTKSFVKEIDCIIQLSNPKRGSSDSVHGLYYKDNYPSYTTYNK